jgi:hypothetical protein
MMKVRHIQNKSIRISWRRLVLATSGALSWMMEAVLSRLRKSNNVMLLRITIT